MKEKYAEICREYAFKEVVDYTFDDSNSGGRWEQGYKMNVAEIPEGDVIVENGEVIGFVYGNDTAKYEHMYQDIDRNFFIIECGKFRELGGHISNGVYKEIFSVALINKMAEEKKKKEFERRFKFKEANEKPMELNELSVEEALEKGVIINDSWNDEAWDVQIPEWKRALGLAEKYHVAAGSTYIDKSRELRTGRQKPYIEFIQKLLYLLMNEANLTGDNVLTVAALYSIMELTDCNKTVLVQEFDEEIAEQVELLQTREEESFREQLVRLSKLDELKGAATTYIFLAVKLLEERVMDLCPLEDWEEDVPHYKKMADDLKKYGLKQYQEKKWNAAIFLSERILAQLDENMDLSRNRNKTVQELYAGWDD